MSDIQGWADKWASDRSAEGKLAEQHGRVLYYELATIAPTVTEEALRAELDAALTGLNEQAPDTDLFALTYEGRGPIFLRAPSVDAYEARFAASRKSPPDPKWDAMWAARAEIQRLRAAVYGAEAEFRETWEGLTP